MQIPQLLSPSAVAAELIGGQPKTTPQPSAPVQPIQPETVSGSDLDRTGHPFRPGFHRINPDGSPFRNRYGNFMPRGGRKAGPVEPKTAPQPVAVAQPETVSEPKQETAPVPEAAPQPSAPAWTDAERAKAATPVAPVLSAAEVKAAAVEAQADVFDSSDDAAEVIALAIFFLIGLLFGAGEDATPSDGEQKKLVKITAALIRATGWKGSAWWAAGLSWAAYFLRFVRKPKAAAKVQGWIDQLSAKAKQAAPVAVVATPDAVPSSEPVAPSFAPKFSGQCVERPAN